MSAAVLPSLLYISTVNRFAEDGLIVLILKIKTQKHFNANRYSKAIERMTIFYLSPLPPFSLKILLDKVFLKL